MRYQPGARPGRASVEHPSGAPGEATAPAPALTPGPGPQTLWGEGRPFRERLPEASRESPGPTMNWIAQTKPQPAGVRAAGAELWGIIKRDRGGDQESQRGVRAAPGSRGKGGAGGPAAQRLAGIRAVGRVACAPPEARVPNCSAGLT